MLPAMGEAYSRLSAREVEETVARLARRIRERFPQASLGDVCQDLLVLSRTCAATASALARPIYWVRVIAAFSIVLILVATGFALHHFRVPEEGPTVGEFIQVFEAGLNSIVLIAAAMFFLGSAETRLKRAQALAALYQLRSIAHIVDMHQLVKDPYMLAAGPRTESSPSRALTAFELQRYLDYSAEMLSLVGKIAALYSERLKDPMVLDAVNDVEDLTESLSHKIGQKLMVLRLERE